MIASEDQRREHNEDVKVDEGETAVEVENFVRQHMFSVD